MTCYSRNTMCRSLRQHVIFAGVDHAAGGTDGTDMYVFGGRNLGVNFPDQGLDLVQIYTVASDTWAYGIPMQFGRGGMGAAPFVDGVFYVIGGACGCVRVCDVYTCDMYACNAVYVKRSDCSVYMFMCVNLCVYVCVVVTW